MIDVSIIIVAWNVRDLLYNCLKSVYEQTKGINFEVIYVDNASSDGSVEIVSKEFPDVVIIKNEENKGFIKANNQGIEISKGKYALLLNSDTLVLDNAIVKTVEFADEHLEAAVVGCKVLNHDGTLQIGTCFMYPSALNTFLYATYLYKIFPKSKFFGRERMSWWDHDDVREVEVISGCFSLVRKEALKQVGLMNEIYYVYGDDPDWCYRFRKKGWKVMFNPKAEIIHYRGQTTKRMARKFLFQLFGSKLIFIKLHNNEVKFQLARILSAFSLLIRVPFWLVVGVFCRNNHKEAIQTAKTYLVGGYYCLVDWKKLLINKETVDVML